MSVGAGANPAQVTPDSAANYSSLEAWAAASRGDWLSSWTQQITNLATSFINWETAMQDIAAVADVDLAQMVTDAFTGIQGTIFTLFPWFQNLTQLMGGIDLSNPTSFDPGGAVETFVTTMIEPLGLLLGPNSAVQAAQLIGSLPLGILGVLPVGALTSTDQNLLLDPTYRNDASIDETDWFWTSTPKHSTTGGSAAIVLDGVNHELLSDPPMKVATGQTIKGSHWVRWAGVTHTGGNVFQLGIVFYDAANTVVTDTTLANIANPAAASSNAPQSNFVLMEGETTVPANAVWARLRLTNLAAGTAGTAYWSDAKVTLTGQLQMNWIEGLLDSLGSLLPTGDFNDLLDTLAPGLGTLLGVGNRLFALNPNGTVDASQLSNVSNIPTIGATKITGVLDLARIPTTLLGLDNIFDLQAINDNIANVLSGNAVTGTEAIGTLIEQSRDAMTSLFDRVTELTRTVQNMQAETTAASLGGRVFNINFGDYPDGPLTQAGFTVSYSGAGTSTVSIVSGKAVWDLNQDGNRTMVAKYNTETLTDFQVVRGTMAGPPESNDSGGLQPRIWALARMNAAGTDYVWARAKCTGWLSYSGDIGYTVGGVEHVWVSDIPLGWNMDMRLICGVGSNARRYQVLAGSNLVVDYTEVGTSSGLGSDHRWWGSRADTNGRQTSGAAAGASTVDNAPPAIVGSTFRASRRVTTDTTINSGGVAVPNSFYETVDYVSEDLTYTPTNNCAVTITKAGNYMCTWRVRHGAYAQGSGGHGVLYKNGNAVARGQWCDTQSSFNVVVSNIIATQAVAMVLCAEGDVLKPGFHFTANMSDTGDSSLVDGSESYWTVTRVG